MMKRKLVGLGVAMLLMAEAVVAAQALAQDADDPVARCDRLASDPDDKGAPGRPGVWYSKIEVPAAIDTCLAATQIRPEDARLRYQLARALDRAKRYDEAMKAFEAAAERGYPAAMSGLGDLYYYGDGIPQDYPTALDYYRKSLDAGFAASANQLGQMAENGEGVPKSDTEALRFYRIAEEAGVASAQNNIGVFFSQGRGGLPLNKIEAARLYKLAADQGYALAASNLGHSYLYGQGVAVDRRKAAELFKVAVDSGSDITVSDGKDGLAWLFAADGDLEQAEKLAREAVALDEGWSSYKDTLAYVLHKRGKDAEALPFAEKAIAGSPQYADWHMRHGDILDALGRHDEAKATWRKALALSIIDKPADEFRREVYEAKLAE